MGHGIMLYALLGVTLSAISAGAAAYYHMAAHGTRKRVNSAHDWYALEEELEAPAESTAE
jgi:hypothetical protein